MDLYPFEETVAQTNDEAAIIEKIDIGGISLIRAGAKNYKDVLIIPSQNQYQDLYEILKNQNGVTSLSDRKRLAGIAFKLSAAYDGAIASYYNPTETVSLRYGENPHQTASFAASHPNIIEQLQGKPLSFNNFTDIHAAIEIIEDFWDKRTTVAILKHNNPCGLATRDQLIDAWKTALAGDPVSSFGGIIVTNGAIDEQTATEINKLFYEVLIAPDFSSDALKILAKKKKRVLLKLTGKLPTGSNSRSILNGNITQQRDVYIHHAEDWRIVSGSTISDDLTEEMLFANTIVKHVKSNAIVITKNRQLIGMGCGQTSRIDALHQAIDKAKRFGFDFKGAVLASDAFFPFDDCVKIADSAGIQYVIQPGGSIRDQDSIDYCQTHDMTMVMTGIRHFKH